MKWEIIGSDYLLKTKWLTVRKDHVRMPSGQEMDDYYVLEYPDWINVIAITKEGKFVIERQYRHGTQSIDYELCAGTIEKGESPLGAAQREPVGRNRLCRWRMGACIVNRILTPQP